MMFSKVCVLFLFHYISSVVVIQYSLILLLQPWNHSFCATEYLRIKSHLAIVPDWFHDDKDHCPGLSPAMSLFILFDGRRWWLNEDWIVVWMNYYREDPPRVVLLHMVWSTFVCLSSVTLLLRCICQMDHDEDDATMSYCICGSAIVGTLSRSSNTICLMRVN